MPNVSVDLTDLKRLVRLCFEHDIHARATAAVLARYANAFPAEAMELARRIESEKLRARQMESLRYHRLLEALESANDVAASLADFVR
jgi:hypothetical protein